MRSILSTEDATPFVATLKVHCLRGFVRVFALISMHEAPLEPPINRFPWCIFGQAWPNALNGIDREGTQTLSIRGAFWVYLRFVRGKWSVDCIKGMCIPVSKHGLKATAPSRKDKTVYRCNSQATSFYIGNKNIPFLRFKKRTHFLNFKCRNLNHVRSVDC